MTFDKNTCCCFTGHRALPTSGERPVILERLKNHIRRLYGKGFRTFLAGGAMGFDTYAAEAVLYLKREGLSELRLVLVLPCGDQSARWSEADRIIYERHKGEADEVIVLSERYYDGCMRARNAYMVEHSAACIAYLTHSRSGAAQTVRMARAAGIPVYNCAEPTAAV